jgi:DNA-binding NarL/FixJ family response regulator
MENSTKKIRVLLADDQPVVRVGLRAMLGLYPQIEVVGEAATGKDAVLEAARLKPDVILLDVRLPDGPSFEACRKIVALNLGIHIIFLTSFADDEVVFEAISAGAEGFLVKDILAEELVNALSQVVQGRSILSPSVTHRIMGRIKAGNEKQVPTGIDMLSAQEKRVLAMVAEGKTNKEIGAAMGLSPKTVKNYLSNLMDKLALTRRSQAAAFYAHTMQKTSAKALYN